MHHIVGRRHALLRYDVRNGLPLCAACHRIAETLDGVDEIRAVIGDEEWGYLKERQRVLKKDWLVETGQSEADWRRGVKTALERLA